MQSLSREEAQTFVEDLREENGGLTPEVEAHLAANVPSALRTLRKIRVTLANAIKIVVDNLYSKDTRCLYELIQNAEDNSYSTAIANGEDPFLVFNLYPDRIVIDSNEDGFSRKDLKAICSVGNSTKKQSAGYIGEKGIGFKSVFKIAKEVHIQSGPFSFAFSHTRNDEAGGLGMITPYWEDAEELPPSVRTRMTLTLIDATQYEERAREFREVPDTLLIFLTRLKQLSIRFNPPGSDILTIEYSKRETEEHGLYATFLRKTTSEGNLESASEQKYYTAKSDLHNLPFDEARTDREGRNIDHATVILAFPMDESDEPLLKQQHTYAFLPLRRVGFKFLIQSDFVTQANREDVVHSKRNQAILKGVAAAFADAMVVFCNRPSLRHKWMRYLPEETVTDEFWGSLWGLIREKLEQTCVLTSWSGNGPYKPAGLQRLPESFLANDGTPLLRDIRDENIYLSPKYTETDFQSLRRLGTTMLQPERAMERLQLDLRTPDGSKWKCMERNSIWRTRLCTYLTSIFHLDRPDLQMSLKSLAFIPVNTGKWVSSPTSSTARIYFPETHGITVPADLGLTLVSSMAYQNAAWTSLLSALQVTEISVAVVIKLICQLYQAPKFDNFEMTNAVTHVKYLYWNCVSPTEMTFASQVRLANQYGSLLKKGQYLYFPNEVDDYSPTQLFKRSAQHPGHPVNYLHEDYMNAVAPDVVVNGRSWMTWLEEVFKVRRRPELLTHDQDGLSKEFQYIIDHRSDRLLGTLRHGWDFYRPKVSNTVNLRLRSRLVILENGASEHLSFTHLPMPKLKKIAAELTIDHEYPFVAVSEPVADDEKLQWSFLEDLSVGLEEDLVFYKRALKVFKDVHFTIDTDALRDKLARIYQNIQRRCGQNPETVQHLFEQSLIWIPPSGRIDSSWLSTADCVWDGPSWLKSKQCLKVEFYLELQLLFKLSLQIADASQTDVLNDLMKLKDHCEYPNTSKDPAASRTKPGFQWFSGVKNDQIIMEAEKRYGYLWAEVLSSLGSNALKTLRSTFEDSALVYIPTENAWFPPSRCVWADSKVKIPGKACIANSYPAKNGFFTAFLKVSEPTVAMYIDSLKAGVKDETPPSRVKEIMVLICSLGLGTTDFSGLADVKFLPIKSANGISGFASAADGDDYHNFVIVDNKIHRDAFKNKLRILDFSIEEIRDTRQLLLAMGLEKQFSSKLVKEITDVKGGSRDHEMSASLRIKSQAIVRCIFHFATLNKRQDATSLYRKFKCATVYVSDGIGQSLQIKQDGYSIEGASSRANFHLEESDGILRLYLPKDEVERDVCFESDLPRKLCAFLGITDPGAPGLIGSVFRKDNPAVIAKILENAGVGQIDIGSVPPDEESEPSDAHSDSETLIEATSKIRHSTPLSGTTPHTSSGRTIGDERQPEDKWMDNTRASILPDPTVRKQPNEVETSVGTRRVRGHEEQSEAERAKNTRANIVPNFPIQQQQIEAEEGAYKRILENVVDVARKRVRAVVFESMGWFNFGPAAVEALPEADILEAFPGRTRERDIKLGAAGELYMFEYLKGLALPDFKLENWTSDIRDRTKTHADYCDLDKAGDRSAIADIEYNDTSGLLTRFLVQKGYLPRKLWENQKPFYHIEVKTTISPDWQEPFFMSNNQERHIQGMRIESGKSSSKVYMICRIFNVGKGGRTGINLYIDPETKRRDGELEFNTDKWIVKPKKYQSGMPH